MCRSSSLTAPRLSPGGRGKYRTVDIEHRGFVAVDRTDGAKTNLGKLLVSGEESPRVYLFCFMVRVTMEYEFHHNAG